MTAQRDLGGSVLQVIFSFFLGLVVTAFVAVGVNAFFPDPQGDYEDGAWMSHRLSTSVILLVCATLVMLLSLAIANLGPVLANGALLGGLFTMIYAVGMGVASGGQWRRFLVLTAALVITVGVGWWKFSRGRVSAPAPSGDAVSGAGPSGGWAPPAADSSAVPGPTPTTGWAPVDEPEARLRVVEAKLEALGRALNG